MTGTELRGFDRSLPMALLRAREAVMKTFLPALRANGLSAQQWRVIRALNEENDLDIKALSERCYLLGPSLSRIVANLEDRQLVERRQPRDDQRRTCVHLTRQGRALFKRIAPHSAERYEHIAESFGVGKLTLLYELLDELVLKLDPPEADANGHQEDHAA